MYRLPPTHSKIARDDLLLRGRASDASESGRRAPEVLAPDAVVLDVDHAVAIQIGEVAAERRAEAQAPEAIVPDVDDRVLVDVAGDHEQDTAAERRQAIVLAVAPLLLDDVPVAVHRHVAAVRGDRPEAETALVADLAREVGVEPGRGAEQRVGRGLELLVGDQGYL